jgi:hypothetical protein
MTYPDGIDALVNVNATETLAAGGHAARHNSTNTALAEVRNFLASGSANTVLTAGSVVPTWGLVDPVSIANGSAGYVLTAGSAVPTWAPVTAGGLVLLVAQTLTTVSSVSFNNVFTSTYKNYRIMLSGDTGNPEDVNLRFRASGSDSTASNYNHQNMTANNTTISGARTTGANIGVLSVWSTNRNSVTCDVFNPQEALATSYNAITAQNGGEIIRHYVGAFTATTQFDGFSLLKTTGTITGQIRIYGYGE